MPLRSRLAVCSCIAFIAFAATITAPAQQVASPAKRTLIRAGHLLDVKTGKLSDAKLSSLSAIPSSLLRPAASVSPQPGDEVIDLGSMTVLPGLIDVHTHLTMNPDFDPFREVTSTHAKEAINGVVNARTTLDGRLYFVRNVGAGGFVDVDLRDAINCRPGRRPSHAGQRSGHGHHRRPLR